MEELVFDGTDAGLHADAVRRLFTESKVQDPASEVISTNMDNTAQLPTARRQAGVSNWPTGGEVVEFTVLDAGKPTQQGSSINTDVTTDTGSPEAAVDTDDSNSESQSKSVDSPNVSDSVDQQDLKDEASINDVMMRKEFEKTSPSTDSAGKLSSGGDTFTKRFQEDDERFAFIRECEERLYDGHIAIRPLRNSPIGTVQTLSENDLSFLKFAEREQIRLPFLQTCPEALDT